jgi:hypothetical protein
MARSWCSSAQPLWLCALFMFSIVSRALAAHFSSNASADFLPFGNCTVESSPLGKRDAGKHPLRILPLGASITWGHGSSTGNGYERSICLSYASI